jgi:pimeloyl-ACP methyl ester carboxylesterase
MRTALRARTVTGMLEMRDRLVAAIPATERRFELAGVSTSVLEVGDGPELLLLHGPGEFAAKWLRVMPQLVRTHRVIAPDLPGHGSSEVMGGRLDGERVLAWLDELIDAACDGRPTLVGHVLGGSIAARYAVAHSERLERLVLVDTLGLAPFRPAPSFGMRLVGFTVRPTGRSYERFMRKCSVDLDALRSEMGELWAPYEAYNLQLARTPSVKASVRSLMRQVGVPRIPPEDLERIEVPVALIWGRHDLANRLRIAQTAARRYGWPLHVVDDVADDPARDQPDGFVRALRLALAA